MMLLFKSVRKSLAIAFAISRAASWMALCPNACWARGETAMQWACLRSRSALISRFLFIRSAMHVQQAPLPGLSTGPTSGKIPEGWTSSQGVASAKCCRFTSANWASR